MRKLLLKAIFWIKQLFPLKYDTVYTTEGKDYVCIWHQWFCKPFNIKRFEIVKELK